MFSLHRTTRRGGPTAALLGSALVLGMTAVAFLPAAASADPTPPTITGDPTPAVVGQYYSFRFTVTGDPQCTSDDLPAGLSIDPATCTISGTPTTAGAEPITVTAANGTLPNAEINRVLTIDERPTMPSGQQLVAVIDRPVDFQVQVAGTPTPSVSLPEGTTLPAGLQMDGTGHITGTPTAYAYQPTDLYLQNAAGDDYGQLLIEVVGVGAAITSAAPGDIPVDQPYSFRFTASGTPDPQFHLISGQLPYGLSLDENSGVLSGTPTYTGQSTVTIEAFNGYGHDDRQYTLNVVGVAPSFSGNPPAAPAGIPYSFDLDAGGAAPAPGFRITSGTLPSGLILLSDGTIEGVPQSVGPGTPVTVEASNSVATVSETFTIDVVDGPPVFTAVPDDTTDATLGQYYYRRYYATGRPVAPTFSAPGLPPGLTIDEYGEVEGYPTALGTYTFTVTASNGTAPDAEVTKTIVVSGVPASISGTPDSGLRGQPFDFAYRMGGNPTPTAGVSSGSLPPGLTLSPSGELSGVPTTAGTYTFTVSATNGAGDPATDQTTLTITDPLPVTISGTPPVGASHEPYGFSFDLSGNTWPTVSLVRGTLPPGVQLYPWGELWGTPTHSGSYRFTVRAQDGIGTPATETVTVRILAKPNVSIAPASTPEGNSGTTPLTFTVTLDRASTVPVTVHWATEDNTAAAGSDYQAASGDLTFAPGETSKTVTVLVHGDTTREATENFRVVLSGAGHAHIDHHVARGTIVDDD